MISSTKKLYSEAYAGLSASTWWLSLVMLINRSGTMVVPFMTMYMTQQMKVGIGKAAVVMSLFGAGSVAGSLLGGKITDRIGFYYVQMFTLIGGGIMFIVLGQMTNYTSICIASFFLSMVNEAFRPANTVAIAHYSTEQNRTRSYSLNRLAINLGWAVGGALGGFVAGYNYQLLFWVDGITNIGAGILLYNVLSPSKNAATKQQLTTEVTAARSVYKDRLYLFFVLLQIIFAICFFQLFTILPVFFKEEWHLSEPFIGFTMALNGLLIAAIEMVLVYRLEGRRPHLHYITAGVLLIGLSYAMLNGSAVYAVSLAILSSIVITLGEMLSMPFMNSYWIRRTTNSNRGQYAGLYTMAWSMAQVVGPVTSGQVVEKYGYEVLWWSTGGMCVLLSCSYWLLQKFAANK
jgi:predicted MFS family arabinose efflux permease